MSAYTLGRIARIFVSQGLIDKPDAGSVNYRDILIGAPMLTWSDNPPPAEAEVAPLIDSLTVEEVAANTVDETHFWEGYDTQKPFRRPGRPYKGDEPRKRRSLWVTQSDWEQLKILGKGNASDGLRSLMRDYPDWLTKAIMYDALQETT